MHCKEYRISLCVGQVVQLACTSLRSASGWDGIPSQVMILLFIIWLVLGVGRCIWVNNPYIRVEANSVPEGHPTLHNFNMLHRIFDK